MDKWLSGPMVGAAVAGLILGGLYFWALRLSFERALQTESGRWKMVYGLLFVARQAGLVLACLALMFWAHAPAVGLAAGLVTAAAVFRVWLGRRPVKGGNGDVVAG